MKAPKRFAIWSFSSSSSSISSSSSSRSSSSSERRKRYTKNTKVKVYNSVLSYVVNSF